MGACAYSCPMLSVLDLEGNSFTTASIPTTAPTGSTTALLRTKLRLPPLVWELWGWELLQRGADACTERLPRRRSIAAMKPQRKKVSRQLPRWHMMGLDCGLPPQRPDH